MNMIRIALGCMLTCIASKAIWTMRIIGIDGRAANQRRTNYRRNGTKLLRHSWDSAAKSLGGRQAGGFDHFAPAHQFAVDKALQRFRRRARLRRQAEEYQPIPDLRPGLHRAEGIEQPGHD